MNEWLSFYLAGCALVVVLTVAKLVLHYAAAWMTKANIAAKNLRKIERPEEGPGFLGKVAGYAVLLAIEAAFSWLIVAWILLWQVPVFLFSSLREALSATPERVKQLRFPLRNNGDMSPEAVWAHVAALGQAAGANALTVGTLLDSLAETKDKVPSFSSLTALQQLAALKAVDAEIISDAARIAEGGSQRTPEVPPVLTDWDDDP